MGRRPAPGFQPVELATGFQVTDHLLTGRSLLVRRDEFLRGQAPLQLVIGIQIFFVVPEHGRLSVAWKPCDLRACVMGTS